MIHFLEQVIATIDFNLPWVLPSLETFESLLPLPLRLVVAAALGLWLTTRLRQATPAGQLAKS